MKKILVVHGPNLNLLGRREPEHYGRITLDEIDCELISLGAAQGVEVKTFQSNSEGELVTCLQESIDYADGIIINPAALTHSSIAIRDALLMTSLPVIEVHLTNIYSREPFRHHSTIADIVTGRIMGLGAAGYRHALHAMLEL